MVKEQQYVELTWGLLKSSHILLFGSVQMSTSILNFFNFRLGKNTHVDKNLQFHWYLKHDNENQISQKATTAKPGLEQIFTTF